MSASHINAKMLLHLVSVVIVFESFFILLAAGISVFYGENNSLPLAVCFLVICCVGLGLNMITKKQKRIEPNRKESFLIVTISWVILGLIGSIPYLATNSIPDFTNALFESISGFTTTGSSILSDIETLPKSILFWRAETHWIGGMGIIVLVVAIMPFLNIKGIYLFYSEISSNSEQKITTKIRHAARNLWLVYIGLTIFETVLLYLGNMPLFDSVCHSFATIATGGFSTQNNSIAEYSSYIQYIITLFMILSGINFTIHVLFIKGRFNSVLKNEELKLYLTIILFSGFLISAILYSQNTQLGYEKAFRDSFFQVASIITATGFVSADYLKWPNQAIIMIGVLMLIGASAGSTGGGVKVIRNLISFKRINQSFRNIIWPNSLQVIRYNGIPVKQEYISGVFAFIILYYLILIVSIFVIMLFGHNAATAFGASATCLAGIGPGFGSVGPTGNFLYFQDGAKFFLCFLMILGRLEIYAVLILFTRTFWRN